MLAGLMVAGSINGALNEKKKRDELTIQRQRKVEAFERQSRYLIQISDSLDRIAHDRRIPDLSPPSTPPLQ